MGAMLCAALFSRRSSTSQDIRESSADVNIWMREAMNIFIFIVPAMERTGTLSMLRIWSR